MRAQAGAVPDVTALADHLRTHAFALVAGRPATPRRIGAEVELLALDAATGTAAPIEAREGDSRRSLLAVLRTHGAPLGWTEARSAKGVPRFDLPGGGSFTFEPGGQLEYASPPCGSATVLVGALRAAVEPLRRTARDHGIALVPLGIDPVNPPERAPLQLQSERYCRMADYFAALGPAGARMMRQTAAMQVSLDLGDEPLRRWHLLNALAPFVVAIFANSPRYAGAPTGHASFRAATWRALDSSRTGLPCDERAPIAAYLEFALCAPDMMRRAPDGRYLPFCGWLARGAATLEDWETHLTTLFPEVRPRGYFEVRSADAIDPAWYAAPIAFLAGLAYDDRTARSAAELVRGSDPSRLVRAGEAGLADPALAPVARDLFELSLEGCRALGPGFVAAGDVEVAREFFDRYTRVGRAPADDVVTPAAGTLRRCP